MQRHDFAERKIRVGLAAAPMMMALGREEESFHVGAEPLQEFVERQVVRCAGDSLLFGQNLLGVHEIVPITVTLQDKIKTMDRDSGRLEKLRDCVEA